MNNYSITEARQLDMVDYLASLGHHAKKIKGDDYWYLSPLREERTPSFKIKRSSNIWYDHGTGEGGTIIDFGMRFHKLDIKGFLELLVREYRNLSFQPKKNTQAVNTESSNKLSDPKDSKILITATRPLSDPRLLHYIEARAIPLALAQRYCFEVDFMLYKKKHVTIGFPNEDSGCELRNAYFKGSTSPKTFRFFNNGYKNIEVFEGFFDFLSWLTLFKENQTAGTNFLILNSLSFFKRARPLMESHAAINLWLDHGKAGDACIKAALATHPAYKDKRELYKGFDDLNAWLVHEQKQQSIHKSKEQTNISTIKNKHHGRI